MECSLIVAFAIFFVAIADAIGTHKKVGCFYENQALTQSLFNRRSEIKWRDFYNFTKKFAADCEIKARSNTFRYFSIRFFGICVGIPSIDRLVLYDGCINTEYTECQDTDELCVGRGMADMTYLTGRDGGYSTWSEFSGCIAKCGRGIKKRERQCNNPTTIPSGRTCDHLGASVETKACYSHLDCPDNLTHHEQKCKNGLTGICKVDGGFSKWSTWTGCGQTCGGGSQMRERTCSNPKPQDGGKDCVGNSTETKACVNSLCPGPEGVAKAQVLVETSLESFHKTDFPDKSPSGKFYKAMFAIQDVVAKEFISDDPSVKAKTFEKRLEDLEMFLQIATKGGSIDYARTTLGKSLYTLMKININKRVPLDDMDAASANYLQRVKELIGKDKYNQITSSEGDSTLMFTMDTTGSMSGEIRAAKAMAISIINATRDFKVDYILSPFNDPSTGPVTYKSEKDRKGFVNAIGNLRASGGGDCPELAFKGMLNALNEGPKFGSPMFVFTDATAKDDDTENMVALKAMADSYSSTITFFTNLRGCTGGYKRGIVSYRKIAAYTSGNIFPLKNEAELLQFTDFIKSSLQQDTLITSGGTLRKSRMKRGITYRRHPIQIDDGILRLILSATVSVPNSASHVTLMSPSGMNVDASKTLELTKIFDVNNIVPGTWFVTFPSTTGEYRYNAQAISKTAIDFTFCFMYQDSPRRNSPPYPVDHPVRNKQNMVMIRIGGVQNIVTSSLRSDIVDLQGKILMKNNFEFTNNNVLVGRLIPPNVPFKVRLTGTTKSGTKFERSSSKIYTSRSAFMRASYAGDDFTAKIGQSSVEVQLQVLNQAPPELMTYSVKVMYGTISPTSGEKYLRMYNLINFSYNAPQGKEKRGRNEQITITAMKDSGEKLSTTINILLT